MFKKGLIISLSLLALFGITGCNNKENNNDDTNNIQENDKQNTNTVTLNNLESKIKDLGITVSKTQTSYEMVGAKNGYKLKSGETTLEVYQYDTNSESYKSAEANQKITLEEMNMSFDAIVKNGYAYILDGNFPQYDKVIEILNKLQ